MKHDHESKMLFNTVSNALNYCTGNGDRTMPWFFCFGTLEEYIADLTFGMEYDIDVGVIADKCDSDVLVKSIESSGYKLVSMVRSDHTKKPLKAQFKIFKDWPDLDVYFWIEHKGMLYHTYDEKREKKEILSSYTFRGIKKEWVIPDAKIVERLRRSGPEMDRMLDVNGIWHYDIFGDHSGHEFLCPFSYGACLDTWYPVWRFRKYYRGNSMSPWVIKTNSCKGLC